MKEVFLEQGSEAWLDLRREKITSTDCAPIMGRSRYKTKRDVWLDKMGRWVTVVSSSMQKGSRLEPKARRFLELKFGTKFPAKTYLSDSNQWQMASLDGYSEQQNIIIEIKIVGESAFTRVKNGSIPEQYILQCAHHMACTEDARLVLLAFFLFSDEDVMVDYKIEVLKRNEEMIKSLTYSEHTFYRDHVISFKDPG